MSTTSHPEASCETCDEDLVLDAEGVWQHADGDGSEGHEAEPRMCSTVTFWGSPNPDSPRFGPDETCDNVAAHRSSACYLHGGDDCGD